MQQPNVKVGIMSGTSISFSFAKDYTIDGKTVGGSHTATLVDGEIEWNGNRYPSLEFTPVNIADSHFTLIDVTIGVNFHWERKENQSFRGSLRLIVEGDKLTAVNILPIEEYLLSVISSEMSATASLELLKAHAVISRSWLLAQIDKNKQLTETATAYCPCTRTDGELVRWFDREDHVNFDVCADDHCQRYQG
ncbi:MAG: SpoIID/LytB domain-containing protein, partial [Candidatus Limisoma sp.]|nr:SpoIID/LytB domain-containing protein [Candidatus Limisoma sp.]